MAKLLATIFLLFISYAICDVYMHNPRGSNDRLNEANTNRNNGNRLFDSQNNAKGGYCVGPAMTYYEGSQLSVEWTNQHGCGNNPKVVCNVVIQYMCGSTNDDALIRIRDGTTTNTPNTNVADATAVDANGNLTFGVHESLQSYLNCARRMRNMGLYIADRAAEGGLTPNRAAAIFTRQNNNGNRQGYECAEERDYYPYWHPSEWKDVAILTSDKKFCDFYQAESQNVKAKGYCYDPANSEGLNGDVVHAAENNPSSCTSAGHTWAEKPAWGIAAPDCKPVPWSRENHLGNGADGFANRYNMTMPRTEDLSSCINDDTCVCALRLRYNISNVEDAFPDMSRPDAGFIDYNQNGATAVNTDDPVVNMTDGDTRTLELAVDTTQFGRTFQDRSHTFKISKRPAGVPRSSRLYNLNVRGKRGNIVQAYPSVEYDFVPQYLYTRVGDYIHFQWTGCDTNPAGNAGEGKDGTDRSNFVQIISLDNALPITDSWIASNPSKVFLTDKNTRVSWATLNQDTSICLTREEILAQNGNNAGNAEQDDRNCGKLNTAENYFDGGVIKVNTTGKYYYMSTRNHNFTNRDQKGVIYVENLLPTWAIVVVAVGGALFVGSAGVAGAMFYAKSHPHSGIANLFSKI